MKNTNDNIINILLDTPEWETFECKRAAVKPSDALETIIAFANTDGGLLVLGLEDSKKVSRDKRIIGISENSDNVSNLLKILEKEIDPPVVGWEKIEIDVTNTQGLLDKIIIISVKKSNEVHSSKSGNTFIRKGSQNIKIGATEITRIKYEKGSIKYEDEISEIKDINDLDKNLLDGYKKFTTSDTADDWQFLKDNGLAINNNDNFLLTKAGVLLFGKNPSVLLKSKVGIKISHYFGKQANNSGEPNFVTRPFTIEGPLITQIEKAIDYFRNIVKSSKPKLQGASFRSTFLIPEWAFQEAVTNAVIHRNYSLQDDIHIRFFDDRVEIESPGTYPGHITPSNIRSERFARNPLILRTLNRSDSAPNLDIGEGVNRMYKVMKDANLYEPFFVPPTIRPNSVLVFLLNQTKVEYWDTVSNYLDANYRITNQQARGITGITDSVKMSRLLNSWVDQKLLEKMGTSKKDSYYRKPGQEIPKSLFSKGAENRK